MTRGDLNLLWLRERFVDGSLSFETFETCVEVNLTEQAKGWAQEIVRAKEMPRWMRA